MNIVIGLLARDTVEDISFHTSSSRSYDSALERSKPTCRPGVFTDYFVDSNCLSLDCSSEGSG